MTLTELFDACENITMTGTRFDITEFSNESRSNGQDKLVNHYEFRTAYELTGFFGNDMDKYKVIRFKLHSKTEFSTDRIEIIVKRRVHDYIQRFVPFKL